jgi:hypothetical protein
MRLSIRTALLVPVLCAAAGCSTTPADSLSPQAGPQSAAGAEVVTLSDSFLHETLTDWVSYSTDIALVTVTGERDHEPDAEVVARGEGYVGRSVSVRVDRVLWRAGGDLHAPRQLSFDAQGYIVREGERLQSVSPGSPTLEPGEQFVMPLSYVDGVFGPLSTHSPIPFRDGLAAPLADQDDEAVRALAGKDADQITSTLARTRVDALAQKHMDLPPYERVRAVLEERRKQQTPG